MGLQRPNLSHNLTIEHSRSSAYKLTHSITIGGVKARLQREDDFTSAPFSCEEDLNPVNFQIILSFGNRRENWLAVYLGPLKRNVFVEQAWWIRVFDVNWNELGSVKIDDYFAAGQTVRGSEQLLDLLEISLSDDVLHLRCDVHYVGASTSDGAVALGSSELNRIKP